jgi:hypothetical protein
VGQANGERMLHRLGESAELRETQAQPDAIVDRCRCGAPEIVGDPVGGQDREVVGSQLDHPLVLAPEVTRILKIGCSEDAESQVPETPGDL